MMQQVNLYQDSLKTRKPKYTAEIMGKLLLLTFVVGFSVVMISAWQLYQQQEHLAQEKQHHQQALEKLQKVQQQLASMQKGNNLEKQLAVKSRELANKQKVLNILSGDQFGNTAGFAEQITGFARQRVDGLWLTELSLAEGGTNLSLHGTTSRPELLPKYLQRLSAEKIFSGTEFKTLVMARREQKPSWLDFSLLNKTKEPAQ